MRRRLLPLAVLWSMWALGVIFGASFGERGQVALADIPVPTKTPTPRPTQPPAPTPTPVFVPTPTPPPPATPTPTPGSPTPTPSAVPTAAAPTPTPAPPGPAPTVAPTPSSGRYVLVYTCKAPGPSCQNASWMLELTLQSTAPGVTVEVKPAP